MPTEEERQAAEDARLRKLAGGASDEPGSEENNDDTSTSTEVDSEAPTDDEIRAANEAGEVEQPDPNADPDPEAEADAPRPVPGSDTFRGRISQLSADKRTLKQRLAEAEAENARLRAGGAAADPPVQDEPGAPQRQQFATTAEFNAAVAAEATRRAATSAFNEKCNAIELKGSQAFGAAAWAEAKNALALLDDDGFIPMDLLAPALETDHPHRIILALGQDPDLADRLLRMNPVKRAMEIARMEVGPPPVPRRTAAPPPVEPIRGRAPMGSSSAAPSDKDDDATWLRKRNAEIKAKEAARA